MKNFDDIFRERLHDFEAGPDDALWHKILPLIPKTTPWWGGHKTTLLAATVVVILFGLYPSQPPAFDVIKKNNCDLVTSEITKSKSIQYISNQIVGRGIKLADGNLNAPLTEVYSRQKTTELSANILTAFDQKMHSNSKTNALQSAIQRDLAGNPTGLPDQMFEAQSKVIAPETILNDPQTQPFQFVALQASTFKQNNFKGNLPTVVYETTPDAIPEKTITKPRMEWFGSVMPLFSYLNVRPTATDQTFVSQVQAPATLSTARVGVRLQAGAQAWVSNRVSVRLGLSFSQQNHSLSYLSTDNSVKTFLVEAIDNQKIKVTPVLNRNENNWNSKSNYVGLTASSQYWFKKGRNVSHFVNAGGELYGLLNPQNTAGTKRINAVLKVSYGITKPISTHFSLNIEPTFSYGLTKQFDAAKLLEVRPYHYGFNVGLLWKP